MRLKRFIVDALERSCDVTHVVTHHRPWLWVGSPCPLAQWSFRLDERWGTGCWTPEKTEGT